MSVDVTVNPRVGHKEGVNPRIRAFVGKFDVEPVEVQFQGLDLFLDLVVEPTCWLGTEFLIQRIAILLGFHNLGLKGIRLGFGYVLALPCLLAQVDNHPILDLLNLVTLVGQRILQK